MNIDIVFRPHKAQKEILKAYFQGVKNITINAGRRFGKSNLMKSIAIVEALKQMKVAYITPQYSLAKVFFNEMVKELDPSIVTVNKTDLTIDFFNGGAIYFFSGNGDSLDGNMRGRNFDLCIIDETAFISDLEDKLNSIITPTLTDRDGRMLMISTPLGKNYWYSLCQLNDGVLYKHFHFTSYDNPYLKAEVINRFKSQLSTAQFNQEYLAIAGENANAIVDKEIIDRQTLDELSIAQTMVYGVDVASAHDYTSITGLDVTGKMTYHHHFKTDWNSTLDILKALPSEVHKVVDSTGAGAVIYQQLQQYSNNWNGFLFTAPSKIKLITELRNEINKGNLWFNDITAKELSTYEARLNPKTGYISYNGVSGTHDDTVISLALANHGLKDAHMVVNGNFLNGYSW